MRGPTGTVRRSWNWNCISRVRLLAPLREGLSRVPLFTRIVLFCCWDSKCDIGETGKVRHKPCISRRKRMQRVYKKCTVIFKFQIDNTESQSTKGKEISYTVRIQLGKGSETFPKSRAYCGYSGDIPIGLSWTLICGFVVVHGLLCMPLRLNKPCNLSAWQRFLL